MRRKTPVGRFNIVWLWILFLVAAAVLTAASRAVVAAAPAAAPEEDFVPTETLAAEAAVAFPVDI